MKQQEPTYDNGFSRHPQTGNVRVNQEHQEDIVLKKGVTASDIKEKPLKEIMEMPTGVA